MIMITTIIIIMTIMTIILLITCLTIILACVKVLIRKLFMQKAILLFHISENLLYLHILP